MNEVSVREALRSREGHISVLGAYAAGFGETSTKRDSIVPLCYEALVLELSCRKGLSKIEQLETSGRDAPAEFLIEQDLRLNVLCSILERISHPIVHPTAQEVRFKAELLELLYSRPDLEYSHVIDVVAASYGHDVLGLFSGQTVSHDNRRDLGNAAGQMAVFVDAAFTILGPTGGQHAFLDPPLFLGAGRLGPVDDETCLEISHERLRSLLLSVEKAPAGPICSALLLAALIVRLGEEDEGSEASAFIRPFTLKLINAIRLDIWVLDGMPFAPSVGRVAEAIL